MDHPAEPTEDQRTFLLAMRLNGGTTHSFLFWPEARDEDHFNATLLSLYEEGFVFPDTRGWWAMTARGNMVAQAETLRGKR